MTVINLDEEKDDEGFEFIVDGNTYHMRYPTTEEADKAQELTSEQRVDWLFGLIEAKSEKALPIREVLKTKNVKFSQRFNQMVVAELGA